MGGAIFVAGGSSFFEGTHPVYRCDVHEGSSVPLS